VIDPDDLLVGNRTATQPARDLYDALQLVWLTALVLQHESNASSISLGDGLPQVFNDEVNIEAFRRRGISEADARDYAVVCCVELSIPGHMYGLHDISMFSLLKCYEICLREHPEGFADFEALRRGVEQTRTARRNHHGIEHHPRALLV